MMHTTIIWCKKDVVVFVFVFLLSNGNIKFSEFSDVERLFFFFFLFQLTVFTGVEYFVVFLLLLFLVIEPVHSERNQLV